MQAFATFDQGGAFGLRQLQVGQVLFQLARVGNRADLHAGLQGMADLELAHALAQGLDETVVDGVAHDQP